MAVNVSVTLDGNGNPVTPANPFPTATPATVGVDHSVSAPALLNTLATIAPNANRLAFYVQNQSASLVQVVLDHDLTGSNYSVILVGPGSNPNGQGADWSMINAGLRHIGQIRICAVAGAQVLATEY